MTWVVFDYGGVLCAPPSQARRDALAGAIGVSRNKLWPVYWHYRPAYVTGAVDDGRYWDAVCRRLGQTADGSLVHRLVDLDLCAWSDTNESTVDLVRELAGNGTRLAMLSNAPACLARFVEAQLWAGLFARRYFSADLGVAKPDATIFHRLCRLLGTGPGGLVLVDDRDGNVVAARACGMRALRFTGAGDLRSQLAGAR